MAAPAAPPPSASAASAPGSTAPPEGVNVSALAAKATPAPKSTQMQRSLDSLRATASPGAKGKPKAATPSVAAPGSDRPVEPPKDVIEPPATTEEPPEGKPASEDEPKETPKTEEPPPDKKEAPKDAKPDGKNKQSVGRFIDSLKTTVKNLETENSSLKARLTSMGDMDAVARRMEAAEKRASELESEIKFVNYAKSQEFVEKYQKPYEGAWGKAVSEVSQLNIALEDGSTRKATANDLLNLANAPLDQLDDAAERMFGKSAARVIRHVEKIRELSEAQTQALEEARKTGSEREKQMGESQKRIAETLGTLWERTLAEDSKKLDFLKPKDGDDDWNGALDKSTKFVEDAWKANPADPNLTPEQRAEVIRRHAALRNRAVGFSMLKVENKRLADKLAAVQKELDGIKGSAPTNGNGRPASGAPGTAGNPMDRALADLRSRAR